MPALDDLTASSGVLMRRRPSTLLRSLIGSFGLGEESGLRWDSVTSDAFEPVGNVLSAFGS